MVPGRARKKWIVGRTHLIDRFVSRHGFQPCRLADKEIGLQPLRDCVLQGLKPGPVATPVWHDQGRALIQPRTTYEKVVSSPGFDVAFRFCNSPVPPRRTKELSPGRKSLCGNPAAATGTRVQFSTILGG